MDAVSHAEQVLAMQNSDGAPDFAAYTLESDIRENLKRMYYHAKRVAKIEAHVEGVAAWSNTKAAVVPSGLGLMPGAQS